MTRQTQTFYSALLFADIVKRKMDLAQRKTGVKLVIFEILEK